MKYDRNIIIDNILKLMNDNNTSQSDLAEILDTQQSRISICLNYKKENDFTIKQLAAIAAHYNVSLDSLLGLEKEENTPKVINSLSELATLLFTINTHVPLKFEKITTQLEECSFPNEENLVKTRTAIYFDNEIMESVMAEWRELIQHTKGMNCSKKLLKLWEDDKIKELQTYTMEYHYLPINLFGEKICNKLLEEFNEAILSDTIPSYPDLTSQERKAVKYYLEQNKRKLNSGQYNYLDIISEEPLPFDVDETPNTN